MKGVLSREIILGHPDPIRPLSAVRSTLIQSSLATLRQRGHYAKYMTLLDPRYRETVLAELAPGWLPCDIAVAHYAACEALGLEQDEMQGAGQAVGDRIQGSYIGVIARSAKLAGVTPWVLLHHLDRIWYRMFQGGAVSVVKTGPKDALIDIQSVPLARFDYFRIGLCGMLAAGGMVAGARTSNVQPMFGRCSADRLVYRAAWV